MVELVTSIADAVPLLPRDSRSIQVRTAGGLRRCREVSTRDAINLLIAKLVVVAVTRHRHRSRFRYLVLKYVTDEKGRLIEETKLAHINRFLKHQAQPGRSRLKIGSRSWPTSAFDRCSVTGRLIWRPPREPGKKNGHRSR